MGKWVWAAAGALAVAVAWWELDGGRWRVLFRLPPGPRRIPLLGSLPLLDSKRPQDTLRAWAREFGSVYTIWVGPMPAIVVTDTALIKEMLVQNGCAFTNRPYSAAFDRVDKGHNGVLYGNGPSWFRLRQFIVKELGASRRELEARILALARDSVAFLRQRLGPDGSGEVNIMKEFTFFTYSVIFYTFTGKALERDGRRLRQFKEGLQMLDRGVLRPAAFVFTAFPWLSYVPGLNGALGWSGYQANIDALELIVKEELAEARAAWQRNPADQSAILHRMLAEQKRLEAAGDRVSFSETNLRATLGDMMAAGTETVTDTLGWAVIYLLHHPEVEERCQKELAEAVGRERALSLDDRQRLPYLTAVIHETQRLANILPVSMGLSPDMEGLKLGGWDVPKGAVVMAETSAAMADPAVFPEPERFRPERFLDGPGEALLPFYVGRRACPGEWLARVELFLVLGSLLQAFRLRPSDPNNLPSLTPDQGFVLLPRPFTLNLQTAV